MDFDNSFDLISPDINTYLTFIGDGGIMVPGGTTANRAAASNGIIRYNSSLDAFEVVVTSAYQQIVTTPSIATSGITANNTTQATGTALTSNLNDVSTAASGGVLLLPSGVVGRSVSIKNRTTSLLKVYPAVGSSIDGIVNSFVTILPSAMQDFHCTATNDWSAHYLNFSSTNSLISEMPTFMVNFANSNSLGSNATFTRSSTRFNMNDLSLLAATGPNIPRIFHNSVTGERLGLYIEGAVSNIIKSSNDLRLFSEGNSQLTWKQSTNGLTTMTASSVAGPLGLADVFDFYEVNGVAGTHGRYITTVTDPTGAGFYYSFSIRAKYAPGGRQYFSVFFNGAAVGSVTSGITVDLITGAVTGTISITANMYNVTPCGNGFWKLTITGVTTAAGEIRFIYSPQTVSTQVTGSPGYTGDGRLCCYVGYAQVTDTQPGEYISTTTAGVTLSDVELCTYTVTNKITQGTGTIKAVTYIRALSLTSSVQNVFSLNDTTTSNQITVYYQQTGGFNVLYLRVINGGSTICTITGPTLTTSNLTPINIAIAYATNDVVLYVDGVSYNPVTSATIPTALTTLSVGCGPSDTPMYGIIGSIGIWRSRLSNAKMTELTV